jgi:hypothetical protein
MALVAVIDAQIKCKAPVQEDVKKSRWWKRDRKEGREA